MQHLTQAELNTGKDRVIQMFADAAMSQYIRKVWRLNQSGMNETKGRIMWLYTFALTTYNPSDSYNYLTEMQVESIMSQARKL